MIDVALLVLCVSLLIATPIIYEQIRKRQLRPYPSRKHLTLIDGGNRLDLRPTSTVDSKANYLPPRLDN